MSRVTVDDLTLLDLAQDRIQLSLALTFTADKDVTVKQIVFDTVRMNDVPLYVAPVEQRIALKANQPQGLPEPLKLTLYFRDLNSVKPLQTALAEKRVRLEGTVYLEGELPTLVKLLLLGRRVRVPVTFRQDIPLNVPDNALLQSVAAKALSAAGAGLSALSTLTESLLRRTSTWRDELWKEAPSSILFATVRFTLRAKTGEELPYEFTGAGYRISESQFVLCKGLVEPWKFDPEIASAIKHSGVRLDRATYDISVRLGDASFSQGELKRVFQPADQNAGFYALQPEGRPRKIDLHKRDSAANLVLFEFRNPPIFSGGLKRSMEESKAWDRVAVFRFPGGGAADLVFVPASREGLRIRLEVPVDSSAWGSPVISPDGIIGVVQEQASAVAIKDVWSTLKLR